MGILQIVYFQRMTTHTHTTKELMATLSIVTSWMNFGAKFAKATQLYACWEYVAKQTKKIAALRALQTDTQSQCHLVPRRQAVSKISDLVDGARVWHYSRGEGTLFWRFEIGREDKQYLSYRFSMHERRSTMRDKLTDGWKDTQECALTQTKVHKCTDAQMHRCMDL